MAAIGMPERASLPVLTSHSSVPIGNVPLLLLCKCPQNAEFVPLRVCHDDPGRVTLPNVDALGSQSL